MSDVTTRCNQQQQHFSSDRIKQVFTENFNSFSSVTNSNQDKENHFKKQKISDSNRTPPLKPLTKINQSIITTFTTTTLNHKLLHYPPPTPLSHLHTNWNGFKDYMRTSSALETNYDHTSILQNCSYQEQHGIMLKRHSWENIIQWLELLVLTHSRIRVMNLSVCTTAQRMTCTWIMYFIRIIDSHAFSWQWV